jgi:hypothetical protein
MKLTTTLARIRRLRAKIAYSRIARTILRPLTAEGCRTHWLQGALAGDDHAWHIVRYSKLRGLVQWIAIHR